MKSKRRWAQRLALLFGLALAIAAVFRSGYQEIFDELAHAGPSAAILLGVYLIGTVISSLPLYFLPRGKPLLPLRATMASRVAAAGANALLPTFGFGGDACRLLWMPPPRRTEGVAAIIVDRLLYLVASGIVIVIGVLALFQLAGLPAHVVEISAAIGVAAILAGALGVRLVSGGRIARNLRQFAHRVFRSRLGLGQTSALATDIDAHFTELTRDNRRSLAGGLALFVLARATLAVELPVALWILGVHLDPTEAIIVGSTPVALSFVAGWIPSQLGVQESALAVVGAAIGISPSVAVAAVLLTRGRQIFSMALGWFLVARETAGAGSAASAAVGDDVLERAAAGKPTAAAMDDN